MRKSKLNLKNWLKKIINLMLEANKTLRIN